MPLYDFLCRSCGHGATLMLKHGAKPPCPACAEDTFEKQLAPFATSRPRPAGEVHNHSHASHAAPKSDTCPSSGCAGPDVPAAAGGCRSAYVDSVVKKYLP